jgi:hypothetical protein
MREHLALGVDLRDAIAHRLDLGLPDGCIERVDLPVDVRFRHVVEVDQRQRPTPLRARASTAQEPTPPMPATSTCALRMRAAPATPYSARGRRSGAQSQAPRCR